MQAAIRRGRVLREILKQDRLEPWSAVQQMAWLLAFNEGRLDDTPLDDIDERLGQLQKGVEGASLGLDSPREQWLAALDEWLPAEAAESA